MKQAAQEVIQAPITGLTVGTSTVGFGVISDLATTAEQIGMIAGCILSVCLLGDWIYKKWKLWRA
jgi:hypothetical protein